MATISLEKKYTVYSYPHESPLSHTVQLGRQQNSIRQLALHLPTRIGAQLERGVSKIELRGKEIEVIFVELSSLVVWHQEVKN